MNYETSGTPEGTRRPPPKGRLTGLVDFAQAPNGRVFAYMRNQLLTTRGDEARRFLAKQGDESVTTLAPLGSYSLLGGVADPLAAVARLRRVGILAQPNHVFFAHNFQPNPVFPTPVFPTPVFPTGAGGCGCCCGGGSGCPPHPSDPCCAGGSHAYPVFPTPVFPTPVFPTPVFPTPVFPTPVFPTGAGGCGCGCGGHSRPNPVFPTPVFPTQMKSSARPATASPSEIQALAEAAAKNNLDNPPRVYVLDTGLAIANKRSDALAGVRVAAFDTNHDLDGPDEDGDLGLDPCAGHGTFIAGVVNQVAPGCEVILHRVISTFAWCPEDAIVECINSLPHDETAKNSILSLSFGGDTLDYPEAMAGAIAGVQDAGMVVVASAGNAGTCTPVFPAAFPEVVSVGAIGPNGPAPFTNYGPWVRACAPGVDIVSTFFKGFQGSEPAPPSGTDPDNFAGWARWSGTSFSAPVVAGALARTMIADGCDAKTAVARVIDAPALMRIPNLGTVVNVI